MDSQWKSTFREEIEDFKDTIGAFDRGELDRKSYKGMSGGMGSYAQRDPARHMLRLRMAGGRLTMERLKFLAGAVERGQAGRIKLTTCQTIQLHDLSADQVPQLMDQAMDSAIYSKGGGGDNPRNVMCSPLAGVQPGECFDPTPWAEAAADYLLSICREIHMPRKLKIAFSNGVDDSVHTAFRDMGFLARPDGAFSLRIAGGLGAASPAMGVPAAERVEPRQVLYYIRAMIDTFCAHGNYENRAKARTRFMQETLGPDGLKKAFLDNVAARMAEGGLDVEPPAAPAPKAGDGRIVHPRAIPQKQPGLYAVKYHPCCPRTSRDSCTGCSTTWRARRSASPPTRRSTSSTSPPPRRIGRWLSPGTAPAPSLSTAWPASARQCASRACGTARAPFAPWWRRCALPASPTEPCPAYAFPAVPPAARPIRPGPSASRAG